MQFFIHPARNEDLLKRMEKLAKIAKKLSIQAPEAIVTGVQIWPRIFDKQGKLKKPEQRLLSVEFLGVSPKLEGGWEFQGTLEHKNGGMNLVKSIPGVELPLAYQTTKAFCDHCKRVRSRAETFIVKSETGELKQVGRSCLKDYLGHRALEQIGWLHTFFDEMERLGRDEDMGGGYGPSLVPVLDVLAHSVAMVELHGFFGRDAAEKMNTYATSSRVSHNIWPPKHDRNFKKVELTKADFEKATEILAWIGTLDSNSNYNHNLKVTALHQDFATHRDLGMLASAVFSHKKAMGLIAERQAKTVVESKHFGTIGARDTMTLTVIHEFSFSTDFGAMWIFLMKDEAGNVAKWKTSSPALESGKTYEIKGTIKAHVDYKGTAQTELSRCKVIKELEAQKVAS